MKEFNLQKALAGEPVIDDLGGVGYFMFTCTNSGVVMHLFRFTDKGTGDHYVISYSEFSGRWFAGYSDFTSQRTVGMAPVKKEVWINVYKDKLGRGIYPHIGSYSSEQVAKDNFPSIIGEYIKSIKIHEYED